MSAIQTAKDTTAKIGISITNLETSINELPDGQNKTNLRRLVALLHGDLNQGLRELADHLGIPATELSGGTEKNDPPLPPPGG